MIKNIIKRINIELKSFFDDNEATCTLARISPYSFKYIKEFSLRDGKRIRPLIFVLAYLGFTKKKAKDIYKSAIALELIHAFILMHDDIVDRASLRRGLPSLHKMIGNEKAMITGDILYALGIKTFLSIDESPERKLAALDKLLEAAVHTGCGEINELLIDKNMLNNAELSDIYTIYDQKTSYYTFVVPLVTGAILAGANDKTIKKLKDCGISMGRAFQLRDDMLGLLADEKTTGKSALTDLQEKKITIPLLHAYRTSENTDKKKIHLILKKNSVSRKDLGEVRRIIKKTGTKGFINGEVERLVERSKNEILSCGVDKKYGQSILKLLDKLC
jgi:geranylgeranyl diphosphate synthase, type I